MSITLADKLRVLLVGSGAREHAIAWELYQSPKFEHVFVVPSNGGITTLSKASNLTETAADDYPGLVRLAETLQIGLVVVGPDSTVVDGIEGYFRDSGTLCFAPTKKVSELEGSKAFIKGFVRRHNFLQHDITNWKPPTIMFG